MNKTASASTADEIYKNSASIFTGFYRHNTWHSQGTRSGPGSTIEATQAIRPALQKLFKELGIKSLLDIPCGDFWWMQELDLSSIDYVGMDIVPEMVDDNQRTYGTDNGHVRFEVGNLCSTSLPSVDLVMVRDGMIHQPLHLARQTLQNIAASGAKWALLSTYVDRLENVEIYEGGWRPINLTLAPFNLPPPKMLINESCTESHGEFGDKSLGLWRVEDLRQAMKS